MAKDYERMEDSNRSANPSIHEVSDPSRRVLLLGGVGALTLGALAPWLAGRAGAGGRQLIGFKSVPVSDKDTVAVPEGYEAVAFAAWGEPVGVPGNMPPFRWDASNSAADQAVQMGMHHDGIHYYPIDGSSTHGLLAMNHEYTDDGLLFPDGKKNWTAEKVHKAQVAHGVAVIDQDARTVYCTLTNNSRRGVPNRPAVDAANPRANNTMGHIIQWTEDGDFDAITFRWKHLLLAGNPAVPARYSNWPDFKPGGRPRSATVSIRKANGGPFGT